mmetsp:Transcript_39747/g.40519  ORF Transcript_39747/g.40519 Transcript_39747/m.40519 type:complete len:347 (+) Transcript_39747:177-1217(+)
MVKIRVRFTDVSMNHDNNEFIIKFLGISTNQEKYVGNSMPMLCVRHRLVIQNMFENPYIWYKDEGGRENSIEMTVFLVGENDMKIRHRAVGLRIFLKYDNGHDCPQQDILKIRSDTKLCIDETSGEANIKFRIDEVSRSHQKQLFRVMISPDPLHYPPTSDISPDISVPIEVRSKRSKKEKIGQDHEISFTQSADKRIRVSEDGTSYGVSHEIFSGSSHSKTSDASPVVQSNISESSSASIKYPRETLLPVAVCSQSVSKSPATTSMTSSNISLPHNAHEEISRTSRVEAALIIAINWTNLVATSLPDLLWRCVGYEQTSLGETDLRKPLYSMPNPNELVEKLSKE